MPTIIPTRAHQNECGLLDTGIRNYKILLFYLVVRLVTLSTITIPTDAREPSHQHIVSTKRDASTIENENEKHKTAAERQRQQRNGRAIVKLAKEVTARSARGSTSASSNEMKNEGQQHDGGRTAAKGSQCAQV